MNSAFLHEDICKIAGVLAASTQDERTLTGFAMMLIYCSGTDNSQKTDELRALIKSRHLTPELRSAIIERIAHKGIYDSDSDKIWEMNTPLKVTTEFYWRMMRRPAQMGWMASWMWNRGIRLQVPKADAPKILAHATVKRAKLPASLPRKPWEHDWQYSHNSYFLSRDKRTWDYVIHSMSALVD